MRYKLTEKAYLAPHPGGIPQVLGAGTEIEFHGTPGPHMIPLDDEAKKARAAFDASHPGATLDPTSRLPLTGRDPLALPSLGDVVMERLDKMEANVLARGQRGDSEAVAALKETVEELRREVGALKGANRRGKE